MPSLFVGMRSSGYAKLYSSLAIWRCRIFVRSYSDGRSVKFAGNPNGVQKDVEQFLVSDLDGSGRKIQVICLMPIVDVKVSFNNRQKELQLAVRERPWLMPTGTYQYSSSALKMYYFDLEICPEVHR